MFTKTWLLDTSERVGATFVESFLGIWIASGVADFSLSALKITAASGLVSAAAVLKAAVASRIGGQGASLVVDARQRS